MHGINDIMIVCMLVVLLYSIIEQARIFESLVIQIFPCGTLDETMHLCDVKCVA